MNQILTKEECIGTPDRWQANAERLKSKRKRKHTVPRVCAKALRKLELLEAKEEALDEEFVESQGALSNPFFQCDFLTDPPEPWNGDNPYLNREHQHFDDTIVGIVRSFHSDKSIETHPKEALDLKKVYQLYRYLPFFNVSSIMQELGLKRRQAYLYLELTRVANTLFGITTGRTMPIIPSYSAKDTRNYSAYKKRNPSYFTKKIWWLVNKKNAA